MGLVVLGRSVLIDFIGGVESPNDFFSYGCASNTVIDSIVLHLDIGRKHLHMES